MGWGRAGMEDGGQGQGEQAALTGKSNGSGGSCGTSSGSARHLKSGIPLGVLMPAPTMTTTLWQALVLISSAMSCRRNFF